MKTAARKLTYADYEKIPADGHRHESIEGEEFMTPAPETDHQRISSRLERVLDGHVFRHRLGEILHAPIDAVLSENDIVQPDVVFISNTRSGIVTKKNIHGAPDLVVEILSPSTAAVDRGRKRDLYERSGCAEYWIIDPSSQTIEIHEFGSPRRVRIYKEGQSFESALFPGLTVRLSDVF